MPFLKQNNPKIKWAERSISINGVPLSVIEREANLEVISAKRFLKE